MREIYIKYNPYKIVTDFVFEGIPADNTTRFHGMHEGVRLQEWIEPNGEWEGFFQELYKYYNSPEGIRIKFRGTDVDYNDLQYAAERYGRIFESVYLESVGGNNQIDRLAEIERKLNDLMEGPYEELKDEKIQEAFKKAISPEFEVVVVAPMSSGKSTLINAILGADLLPAVNTATTAAISRIKNVDGMKKFTVYCRDRDGKVIADHENATLDLLNKLNEQARNIECINIEGDIPNIPSEKLNIVFVDTPGGNNSHDESHMAIMKEAVNDENKGMILYVFNFTQLETGDCDNILSMVAQAMGNSEAEKSARDRFIFVCNKMDAQNPETEQYDEIIGKIKKSLEKKGIFEPNLFLTCADACKLVRMKKSGVNLCDSDDDRLYGYLRPFNRVSRQLFRYASIPEDIKDSFQKRVDAIAAAGERESMDAVEINSGVPALEAAIRTYIEKYALAIKIKNVHDVFMGKVAELEMINRSKERWAKSQDEYEKMRRELSEKISVYERDQQLQKFKEKIDGIQSDYSNAFTIEEDFIAYIRTIVYSYPDNVKKSEVGQLLKEFHDQIVQAGNKVQDEFNTLLEDGLYRQCKEILGEYKAYIEELDRKGLLNIGDYNFRKVQRFEDLDVRELSEECISDEYIHSEIVDALKIKKPGFLNAIKRMIDNIDGWDIISIREDFVSLGKYMKEILEKLEDDLVYEFEKEINRAKQNETRVKEFVKAELSDIDKKVKEEFKKIQDITADKKELEKRVVHDRYNMDWLSGFVDEMSSILDV